MQGLDNMLERLRRSIRKLPYRLKVWLGTIIMACAITGVMTLFVTQPICLVLVAFVFLILILLKVLSFFVKDMIDFLDLA